MAEILVIRARLRKRHDRDIQRAVSRLELEEGELSDLVREGFRKVLAELGVLENPEFTRGRQVGMKKE